MWFRQITFKHQRGCKSFKKKMADVAAAPDEEEKYLYGENNGKFWQKQYFLTKYLTVIH